MDLAVQSEARVPHVAQRVGEVPLQVHPVQRGGWTRYNRRGAGNKQTEGDGLGYITFLSIDSDGTSFDALTLQHIIFSIIVTKPPLKLSPRNLRKQQVVNLRLLIGSKY